MVEQNFDSQNTPSISKMNLSSALMNQPPPNFGGVSQVTPVSMSALVSAVRSPGSGQMTPSSGGVPPGLPPGLPNMSNMSGLPPNLNMPSGMSSMAGPVRRRISDKSTLSLAGGETLHCF